MEDVRLKLVELEERITKLEEKGKRKKNCGEQKSVSDARNYFLERFILFRGYEYPRWGAKENSILKHLLSSIDLGKLKIYMDLYLRWKDPFILKKGHAIGLMSVNIETLIAEAAKGNHLIAEISKAEIEKKTIKKTLDDFHKLEAEDAATQAKRSHISRIMEGQMAGPTPNPLLDDLS